MKKRASRRGRTSPRVREPETTDVPTVAPDGQTMYRALFEYAPIGLGVADLEGNLLAFNDAILVPGGYTRADIERLGNVAHLYYDPTDREAVVQLARAQGYVWRYEVRFRRKDGSPYDTLLSLTPVNVGGQACWNAMVEDITERKQAEASQRELEAQLRQAQKMEAVGRMTAGIAHDFNNLLSIILANAELIAAEADPQATELRGDLAELRAAAERGRGTIRKLLAFSRHASLELAAVDVGELLRGLGGMLRHVVPAHIQLDIAAVPGSAAEVDAGAVEQMVLNLASNARDAISGAGRIRIDVSPTTIGSEGSKEPPLGPWMPAGDYVRLVVSDTGSGMDEDTLAHALEPFFTTKPAGVGTGLGLPMVFGLVKQQNGYLDVASTPGKGTVVTLYFPRVAVPPVRVRTSEPPAAGAAQQGCTILLLEDDEALRRTGQRVLQHLGHKVLVAADGAAGLDLFRAHATEIALVVSDAVMPELTGTEVAEAIRRTHPTIPFILWSGYSDREVRALEGVQGLPVLRKPWTIEELAQRVRGALSGPGR